MNRNFFEQQRKSYIEIGEVYFWTATINKWQNLLEKCEYKNIIIDSLNYLSNNRKIDIYAFVIMPNHIHLIWKINESNGKETSQGSFLKYTAHEFKKLVKSDINLKLDNFFVDAKNKKYEFWQRDSLAVKINSMKMAYQKTDYIHNNPLSERWKLAICPEEYTYSSAMFYENGIDNFGFLRNIREEFL